MVVLNGLNGKHVGHSFTVCARNTQRTLPTLRCRLLGLILKCTAEFMKRQFLDRKSLIMELLNFQHVYNYLMKALVKMKVEEEQTRISNANKRGIMITKTRSISMNVSNDAPRQLRRKSSSMS